MNTNKELIETILEATRMERERCASICEAMRPRGGRIFTDEQLACFEALSEAAENIRKGI